MDSPGLNVLNLDYGLQVECGPLSTFVYPKTGSRFISLVHEDGSPLQVGYVDNRQSASTDSSNHAILALPPEANHLFHGLRLVQTPNIHTLATRAEFDALDIVQQRSTKTTIISREVLSQPRIGEEVRGLMAGVFVLSREVGVEHKKFAAANSFDIEAIRQFGREIISSGRVLRDVDTAMLDRYELIRPPSQN